MYWVVEFQSIPSCPVFYNLVRGDGLEFHTFREGEVEALEEKIVLNVKELEQKTPTTSELTEGEKNIRRNLEEEAENTITQLNKK